nr:MAG TPA: hypothetical protein [Caudoviricetes sp.]
MIRNQCQQKRLKNVTNFVFLSLYDTKLTFLKSRYPLIL